MMCVAQAAIETIIANAVIKNDDSSFILFSIYKVNNLYNA